MKISKLRFKNLNSLVGEWQIDFSAPAFAADGIFAITGPTGAGKSTILDALCLALYGRTPRLERIGKSGNEIMSRQTGECFAEVVFETARGTFRCYWSQHRARKRTQGELQPPRHEISDEHSGRLLETKLREVASKVVEVSGMDFDQFTRSMLLAQGGFAAFLQATSDERAPILEQITGTAIYSRISQMVHVRQRAELEKIELLKARIDGIELLDAAQIEELRQELSIQRNAREGVQLKSRELEQAINWYQTLGALERELLELEDAHETLKVAQKDFSGERALLQRALRATTLEGVYASLAAVRRQEVEQQDDLSRTLAALPECIALCNKLSETHANALQHSAQAKEDYEAATPILAQVRLLDHQLSDQAQRLQQASRASAESEAILQRHQADARLAIQKQAEAQGKLKALEAYLQERARDAFLVGGLTGIEEQIKILCRRQDELRQERQKHAAAERDFKQASGKAREAQLALEARKSAQTQALERKELIAKNLELLLEGSTLGEHRQEKDRLLQTKALDALIAELTAHRDQLQSGQPCPLCGALEHPYAQGHTPVPREIDRQIARLSALIEQAENCETAMQQAATAEQDAAKRLSAAEKQQAIDETRLRQTQQALKDGGGRVAELEQEIATAQAGLLEKLQPLGVAKPAPEEWATLAGMLRQRLENWQSKLAEQTRQREATALRAGELHRLEALIESQTRTAHEKREAARLLQEEYEGSTAQRRALFGSRQPEVEERRLKDNCGKAEDSVSEAAQAYATEQQRRHTLQTRIAALQEEIARRAPALQAAEDQLASGLAQCDFLDEGDFTAARQSAQRRAELSARAEELNRREMELKTRQEDREARLARERARQVSQAPLEELQEHYTSNQTRLTELDQKIAAAEHRLKAHQTAQEQVRQQQLAIEAQQKECRRWDNLHELIGSADGKKYRNFAQGLTFEIMVKYANRQLEQMSARYLLMRDREHPLELNVVDSYQAGEIRSTKNLSGGESFIVSLALALGLSRMASHNIRVDSLFLDEGFGSLDDEALESALETLASLRQDGKLIGVISHVTALKERIGTQIQVLPQSGGCSRLQGAGVSLGAG